MLLLLTCTEGKILFEWSVTVPVFSSSISPTLSGAIWWEREEQAPGGTTSSTELWFQRNGEKTFTCPDRSWSNSAKKCGHMWRKQQEECVHPWMFSQRSWTAIPSFQYYLSDEGRLQKTASAFGLSRQAVSAIIWQFCKAIIIFLGPNYIKTLRREPEVKEFVINFYLTHSKWCHNATELQTAHTLHWI